MMDFWRTVYVVCIVVILLKLSGNTESEDCYDSDGTDYRGNVARTSSGKLCLNWTLSDTINPETYPNKGLGNHSYCRNPSSFMKPWCWVHSDTIALAYCDIHQCQDTDTTETSEDDCYIGNGSDYRGNVSHTYSGSPCRNWALSETFNQETHPNKGLGDHNYCRNPDRYYDMDQPWCLVDMLDPAYCNIPQCQWTDTTEFEGYSTGYGDIVRLVGGHTKYDGHIEIYHEGVWSRVCDDGWDMRDAQVVCRQLGFGEVQEMLNLEYHGGSSISADFIDVNCNGDEVRLSDCWVRLTGWIYDNNCPSSSDAGVWCQEEDICNVDILQTVKDFQLSSSSQDDKYSATHSRLGYTEYGWCAHPTDSTPYIERVCTTGQVRSGYTKHATLRRPKITWVDLLIPMVIVGLHVVGWFECPRTHSKDTLLKGVTMFNLAIRNKSSIDDSDMENILPQVRSFKMDTSLDVAETQYFNITPNITARYMRIYPLKAWEEGVCLKFALIGCAKDVMIDFFCEDNRKEVGVVNTGRGLALTIMDAICNDTDAISPECGLAPTLPESTGNTSNNVSTQCEENRTNSFPLVRSRSKCQQTYPVNESIDCLYMCDKDSLCSMAKYNAHDSVCYVHKKGFDTLTMTEDVTASTTIYQRLCVIERKFQWFIDGSKAAESQVVIYSPGYPHPLNLEKAGQQMLLWIFDFQNIAKYPMLLFEDFHFEDPKNIYFEFGGIDWLSLFAEAKISKPTLISRGLTLCRLRVGYRNYAVELLYDQFAFRAIVASSAIPDATYTLTDLEWQIRSTVWISGIVTSRSYSGIFYKEFTSYVFGGFDPVLYTDLLITSFYVSCSTNKDTTFKIKANDNILDFCNLHRPWERLTAVPQSPITIQFAFNYVSEKRPIDGFRAEYTSKMYMEQMSQLTIVEEVATVMRPRNVYRFGSADVALLVDVTYQLDEEDINYYMREIETFLWNIVSGFSHNTTQFGLVSFAADARVNYKLSDHWDKTDMEYALRNHAENYSPERCFACALKMARNILFTEENGDRHTAQNIAVILLNGPPSLPASSEEELARSQSEGIYLHIIDRMDTVKPLGINDDVSVTYESYLPSLDLSTLLHSIHAEVRDKNSVITTEEPQQSTTVEVCTENMCYMMFTPVSTYGDHAYFQTRRDVDTFCGTLNGGSLASIQSLSQLQFIRYYLEKRFGDLYIEDYRYKQRIHIGELRRSRANGKTVYHWSDGSPLVFTAWSNAISRIDAYRVCVVLSLWKLNDDNVWEFGDCSDDSIYFLCKYPRRLGITPDKPSIIRANRTLELEGTANNSSSTSQSTLVKNRYAYYRCNSQEYVTILSVCDGILDCFDGTDETNCDDDILGKDCLHMFQCGSGECVQYSQYCDYIPDCKDASDEKCDFDFCNEWTWQCANGQCVPSSARCNSIEDCLDGSDERDCGECTDESFRCADNKCISQERVCDSFQDCIDSEDENNCNPSARVSCLEWWKAGYRDTGLYKLTNGIDVFNAECDFSRVKKDQTIITKFHDIDYEMLNEDIYHGQLKFSFPNAINFFFERINCEMSFRQTCVPNRKVLTNHMDLVYHEEYWDCLCIEMRINAGTREETFHACSNVTQALLDAGVVRLEDRWYYRIHHFSLTATDIRRQHTTQRYITNSTLQIGLQLGPITCEDKISNLPDDIPCTRGRPVDESVRCLYEFDHGGRIKGCADLTHLQECANTSCPPGFAKCPGSFCIAQRFVCDGVVDCVGGEDESFCTGTSMERPYCNGYFKCKGTSICLPDYQLCDGKSHCPEADDERICDTICPYGCSCTGFELSCDQVGITNILSELPVKGSILDLSGHTITDLPKLNMPLLAILNISSCQLSLIKPNVFRFMKNLMTLDLSFNNIQSLQKNMFLGLKSVRSIRLDGNYILSVLESFAFEGLQHVTELRITNTNIQKLEKDTFTGLNALLQLNLSYNDIKEVTSGVFNDLESLLHLDMTGNDLTSFDKDIFQGLDNLTDLVTDDYIFCCLKPDSVNSERCLPHENEFSSCSDLMRMDGPRFLLWVIGIAALLGNCLALVYRALFDRARLKIGYGIFVTNLCISDFLMGIYLIVIAGADIYYRDIYIWNDKTWRYGPVCQFAGVLSTVSNEASVFFISWISIDRFLVIKFPFGNFKFTRDLAILLSVASWLLVLAVALAPFVFKSYFQDQFYSKNAVCLALPLTRDRPKGWEYSISIFVMFNFLIFLLIAVGQWMIYREIDSSKRKVQSTQRDMNLRVTRNILLVVATDFLCWCPIGIMGILALSGHVISGDVYVWACVLILPINSALNPFLYTFSAIRKRKVFLPSVTEQTADIDSRSWIEIWNCTNFVGPLPFEAPYVSLKQHLHSKRLDQETVNKYVQKLTTIVNKLHSLDLYHGDISNDTIGVRVANGEVDRVVLAVQPKRAVRQEDKMRDMKSIGIIALQLARHCDDEDVTRDMV